MRNGIITALLFLFVTAAVPAGAVDPKTASLEDILAAANEAYQTGDIGTADTLVATARERFPDDEGLVKFAVAVDILVKKDPAAALAEVDKWLAAHDATFEWNDMRAELLRKVGREDEALAALDDLIAASPSADLYLRKGHIYLTGRQRNDAAAITAYETGLTLLKPDELAGSADVFYNLACAYAATGDAGKAVENLGKALYYEPRYAETAPADPDVVTLLENAEFQKLINEALRQAEESVAANMTVKPGQPAPAFTLVALDGKDHSLADFRGKYVVLNIFATWCPPCRAEIPDLAAFATEHDAAGVVVLAISVDAPDADLAGFVKEMGITYLVLKDSGGAAKQYLGAEGGIPQTYFIDKNGIVITHIYGGAPRDTFERKLKKLLAG